MLVITLPRDQASSHRTPQFHRRTSEVFIQSRFQGALFLGAKKTPILGLEFVVTLPELYTLLLGGVGPPPSNNQRLLLPMY